MNLQGQNLLWRNLPGRNFLGTQLKWNETSSTPLQFKKRHRVDLIETFKILTVREWIDKN